jgi:hypothetical protein
LAKIKKKNHNFGPWSGGTENRLVPFPEEEEENPERLGGEKMPILFFLRESDFF